MNKKKLIALTLASTLAATSLFGCSLKKKDSKSSDENYKIGIMQFGEFTALQNAKDGFVDGMKDAGYVDGENITYNYQSAAADTANCATIANTLVNDNSDLVLAIATPSAAAMKEKTTTIPVLFTAVTDPVASGLIADAEKPGGNITGTSDMNPVDKQVNLLLQLVPNAKTVAVMYCSNESNSKVQFDLAKAALEKNGVTVVQKTISEISEAKAAVESLKGQVDALYIPTDNTIADSMPAVADPAKECKIPIICGEDGMVKNGGLATYGIDYYQLGKQTAEMAVKILKGEAKAGDIPVGYQTEESVLSISINKATAQACGITIPDEILDKATNIYE